MNLLRIHKETNSEHGVDRGTTAELMDRAPEWRRRMRSTWRHALGRFFGYRSILLPSPVACSIRLAGRQEIWSGKIYRLSPRAIELMAEQTFPEGSDVEVMVIDGIDHENILVRGILNAAGRCVIKTDNPKFTRFYLQLLTDEKLRRLHAKTKERSTFVVPGSGIQIKVAETAWEREQAYRLVYDEYLKRQFTLPNEHKMFTYMHLLLPQTTTIIGVLKGRVVMTVSAIQDSVFKLPMDRLFGDVTDPLRREGRNIVEFGLLATNKQIFKKGAYSLLDAKKLLALFSLFRFVTQHSIRNDVTDVVIAVNPRYESIYRHIYFERMSPELRYYHKFNNGPAMALRLDLTKRHAMRASISNFFFKVRIPDRLICGGRALTESEVRYLFEEKSDLAQQLSDSQIEKFRDHVPELKNWAESILKKRNISQSAFSK